MCFCIFNYGIVDAMKDYLKWFITGSIFIIPFISFIVINDMFFPFIVGKNFAFRILVEMMFGAWIALAVIDEQYRPKISTIVKALVFFVAIVGIANIFGANFDKSFWSNYERMDGYITTLHLFMYFLVAGSVFILPKRWDNYFNIMIIVSVILGFIGISELIEADFQIGRLSTTLGNAIYLAVYMLFHIFITVYMLFKDEIKEWGIRHFFYIGAILVQVLNLYATATRGTVIGLIVGISLTMLIIALFEKKHIKLKKVAMGLIGSVVILVSMFITFRDSAFVQDTHVLARFTKISLNDSEGRIEDRFLIWGMAYEGFLERPVLGWGQGNFPYVFNKYYDPRLFDAEPWFDRAHNVFFDWLISAGIVGLLSYLSIFVALLYLLWRIKDEDMSFLSKAIFTGLLAAYFIHNVFVFDNLVSYILFFTVVAFIHSKYIHNKEPDTLKRDTRNLPAWKSFSVDQSQHLTVVTIMGVITLAAVYMLNYPAYAQNKTLLSALYFTPGRVPPEQVITGLDLYKKALEYDSFGNGETRERLLFHAQSVYGNNTVDPRVKAEFMQYAAEEMSKQIDEMPGESKYPLFASGLFSAQGNFAKAEELLEKARSISPKKDIVLLALGDVYLNSGRAESALVVYKDAFENTIINGKARNHKAALRYALAALYIGNDQLANDILIQTFETHLVVDPPIINFYVNKERFDVVRDIYEHAIEKENNDPKLKKKPEYRFQLAGIYLKQEERDKAIETLEQAMLDLPEAQFPAVHSDAKKFIEQIKTGEI